VDQLSKIFDVLGTPQDPALTQLCSQRVLKYLKSWPKKNKMDFSLLFPKADNQALDFIDKLLTFDPLRRISAEDALAHPYLSQYHYPDDEVGRYFSFEK
jgi:serine/threonine protein kinase